MRSVSVAELKNRRSKYLAFAKGGEEIVIRDRNLPVAKLGNIAIILTLEDRFLEALRVLCGEGSQQREKLYLGDPKL